MIDIKFLRENPEAVKENIRKKFQDHKLPLVDEVSNWMQKQEKHSRKQIIFVQREINFPSRSVL